MATVKKSVLLGQSKRVTFPDLTSLALDNTSVLEIFNPSTDETSSSAPDLSTSVLIALKTLPAKALIIHCTLLTQQLLLCPEIKLSNQLVVDLVAVANFVIDGGQTGDVEVSSAEEMGDELELQKKPQRCIGGQRQFPCSGVSLLG